MLKKIASNVSIAALFLIPIFPLIVANSYFFPFITGKAFFFRILVEVAFAGWLLLCFIDARYRPRLSPLTIAVTAFALIALVADLLGVNPLRSIWSNFERMEGWLVIAHLWAFFMVIVHMFGAEGNGRRMWQRWISWEITIAAIVAIYGIFQIFGWAAIHQGSSRIDASLGNAAYMAVYMLWNVGLAAYMFLVARARGAAGSFAAWTYAILAVLFAFEVFMTATRGTILGLVGGIMLACFLYAILGKNEKKTHRIIAGAVILVFIALGAGLVAAKDTAFVQGNEVLNRMATISWSEAQGQARNVVWPMAVGGALERPILGWGQENFNYIFNANYDPRMWNQEQWFDRAHSVYLDWLTATGFVGLAAYLALYVLLFMAIWKSSLGIREKSVLTGLVAGYAGHNIFVFDNLASYVLFFAVLGFAASLREAKPLPGKSGSAVMSSDAAEYVAAPIVVIALVGLMYFVNIRPIQANNRLIDALRACSSQPNAALFQEALAVDVYMANQEIREQLLSCAAAIVPNQQVPGPIRQSLYDLAVQAIQDQIAATPLPDARIYTLGGSFQSAIGQFDQAIPFFVTALEASPGKQSIATELANSYLNSGRMEEALAVLEPAYLSDTRNDRIRGVYVLALVLAGQEARAREMFADQPDLFQSAQMARAYMILNQHDRGIAIYESILASDPSNVDYSVQLAQAQYAAGRISASVATLEGILVYNPEYKELVEASIREVRGY